MHDFRKLEVWDEAIEMAVKVYALTLRLPDAERFGLTAQLRSAAISVSSNIAEAAGRGGTKDMARFLRMALGSLWEVDSQLELATRLTLVDGDDELHRQIQVLGGRLRRLHNQLTSNLP